MTCRTRSASPNWNCCQLNGEQECTWTSAVLPVAVVSNFTQIGTVPMLSTRTVRARKPKGNQPAPELLATTPAVVWTLYVWTGI